MLLNIKLIIIICLANIIYFISGSCYAEQVFHRGNGEEVERFQADLSFAMQAKLEDIQDVVDEILMEDF